MNTITNLSSASSITTPDQFPLKKRKNASTVLETNSAHKYFKTNTGKSHPILSGLLWFEVIQCGAMSHIVSYLSPKELLNFELVIKIHSLVTGSAWANLRKRDYLEFDWAACQFEKHQNKWTYCLSAALIRYIENKECSSEMLSKFQGIMKRFPSFESYIQIDILRNKSSSHQPLVLQAIQKQRAIVAKKAREREWGGEYLLQGLFEIEEFKTNTSASVNDKKIHLATIGQVFKSAIENKATCASLLAFDFLKTYHDEICQSLAIQAAEKGDFRALEKFVRNIGSARLKNIQAKHPNLPPVLIALAIDATATNNFQQAEVLFSQAIKNDKFRAPAIVLTYIAYVKYMLQKWPEADIFHDRAIAAYKQDVPASVLSNAAFVKFKLGKLTDAGALYDKAVAAYGQEVPARVLSDAAFIKLTVKKWIYADALYEKAVTAYGQKAPARLLAHAAFVKIRLGKLAEANIFNNKAISAYRQKAPGWVSAQANFIKSELGKQAEADVFRGKILQSINNQSKGQKRLCPLSPSRPSGLPTLST